MAGLKPNNGSGFVKVSLRSVYLFVLTNTTDTHALITVSYREVCEYCMAQTVGASAGDDIIMILQAFKYQETHILNFFVIMFSVL